MPKPLRSKLFIFILILFFISAGLAFYSAAYWLKQPNNFIFTKEASGSWSPKNKSGYRASGYNLKIDSGCAKKVYDEIKPSDKGFENEMAANDFKRFLDNKASDVEFETSEISYTGRFKWFQKNYITYNDPSLHSGVRFSFANKCLYDKDCTLNDSLDYLLVKIGVKYLISEDQKRYLLEKCISSEKVFFKIKNTYNFGRSQIYYRNGMGIWFGIWYNMLTLIVLFSSAGLIVYYLFRRRKKNSD